MEQLIKESAKEIDSAKSVNELILIKSKYLGKKSQINDFMKELASKSAEEKKEFGMKINNVKKQIEEMIEIKKQAIDLDVSFNLDETLPVDLEIGSLSPITIVTKELVDTLTTLGFKVVSGPEMENDWYNFEGLNIPKNHPARDMQDTYFLDNGMLLRTHTSNCQVRTMESSELPLKMIAPGRVFRNEDQDASHDNTFFQLEGMVIDKEVSIPNLIYVMKNMLSAIFKEEIEVRLRPGYFPFVEPGFELDMKCVICKGKGCPTCKNSGYIEMCPCGMIHPKVLKLSGIDEKEYSGFAFGLGLTRFAMMKYKINDIRHLNSGDIKVLSEFNIK